MLRSPIFLCGMRSTRTLIGSNPLMIVIDKVAKESGPVPNLANYQDACASFSWSAARALLDDLPNGRGLNIAHEAVDRHVAHGRGDKVALRWLAKDGSRHDFTYRALGASSSRFANVLRHLGVNAGDRVFALAGRIPALYVAALGTWKAKGVFCSMFSAFGPEPIRTRMSIGGAKVLITTTALYEKKIAPIRAALPALEHVLLADDDDSVEVPPGTQRYTRLMAAASDAFEILPTAPEDPALLHFTSGTTGTPKGAVHVHEAVVAHHITGQLALDLHPEDIFWCTADPGWVTGTSYGIIAPLTNGVTSIIDEQDFDAERWVEILDQQAVSVWYTAPTAIRMMMKAGVGLARARQLPALRFLASVGEPLNPEAVRWGVEAFNLPFHDNWWQTETGGIMIANYQSLPIRPGSMGKPMPGIEVAIVQVSDEGKVCVQQAPDVVGELALKQGWPSMFRSYLNEPARYEKCFADGWYLTGDLARRDADGYLWFVGRKDDVIKTSGHLIGPFEVESVLMEHAAVAEAGVIGKPDPMAMEIVKAFVALKQGFTASDSLRRELLAHARKRLGAVVAPKEIEFRAGLPKTRSGKIMRRLLKAQELRLPEGDTSTLEKD